MDLAFYNSGVLHEIPKMYKHGVGFGYVPLAYFPGFPFPEHLFPGSPGYPGIDRFDVFFYSKLNKYVHYSYVLKL